MKRFPFFVETEEEAELVARYLIEDNIEDHVEFDLDRTNKLHIVKSIFKNLVGSYKILEPEEEENIRKSTVEVLKEILILF